MLIVIDDNLIKEIKRNPRDYIIMENTGLCKWTPRSLVESTNDFIDKEFAITDLYQILGADETIVWITDPEDDLAIAELVGHTFALPQSEMDKEILLLFRTTRLESETRVFEYSVPGCWFSVEK